MFYQIYAITIKELKILFRSTGTISTLFLMPVMFILVMSIALNGVFDSGSENNPISLLVANADRGEIAQKVINNLKDVNGLTIIDTQNDSALNRAAIDALIMDGSYHIGLVFPADFSEKILAQNDQGAVVTYVVDPSVGNQMMGPVRGMVQGYIEREASLAQAPANIQAGFDNILTNLPPANQAMLKPVLASFTGIMTQNDVLGKNATGITYQEEAPTGMRIEKEPTSAQQNVPGYTIFGVFFIIQSLALSIYEEKSLGTFRRLQAAPLSRAALLIGKLLPYFIINLIQIALMFAVGVLVFHIELGHDILALALVSITTAAAANGLGLMIAALAKTREQMSGVSTLLSVTLAALGGMMVPVYVMPEFMQSLSKVTPHAWALQGFQDVIVRGLGLMDILPESAALMGFALLFFGVALWRFRFE
ncbi:MAG: ABC transporter permease [Anaerolineae bacterium]|nr:ABC transporter permease [Anaerolineae bacterium]